MIIRTAGQPDRFIESDPVPAALSRLRSDIRTHLHRLLDAQCASYGWPSCKWRNFR